MIQFWRLYTFYMFEPNSGFSCQLGLQQRIQKINKNQVLEANFIIELCWAIYDGINLMVKL